MIQTRYYLCLRVTGSCTDIRHFILDTITWEAENKIDKREKMIAFIVLNVANKHQLLLNQIQASTCLCYNRLDFLQCDIFFFQVCYDHSHHLRSIDILYRNLGVLFQKKKKKHLNILHHYENMFAKTN